MVAANCERFDRIDKNLAHTMIFMSHVANVFIIRIPTLLVLELVKWFASPLVHMLTSRWTRVQRSIYQAIALGIAIMYFAALTHYKIE